MGSVWWVFSGPEAANGRLLCFEIPEDRVEMGDAQDLDYTLRCAYSHIVFLEQPVDRDKLAQAT